VGSLVAAEQEIKHTDLEYCNPWKLEKLLWIGCFRQGKRLVNILSIFHLRVSRLDLSIFSQADAAAALGWEETSHSKLAKVR
jgi:hypothetical protein